MVLPEEYVASTYWTVTESPALAAGPLPWMRSADSRPVGGAPAGTVTVGAVPAVPAGDRSAAGMGAGGAAVVVGAAGVVVVGLDEALLHPARPRVATESTTRVRVRVRDMGVPFQT